MAITKDVLTNLPADFQTLLETSPYPLALCDETGGILLASQSLIAAESASQQQLSGRAVQSVQAGSNPLLLGQLNPKAWLYGWIRPTSSAEEQVSEAVMENRIFQLALDQIGLQVFEYRIDRDQLRLLSIPDDTVASQTPRRGGPEIIAEHIHASEEDMLYLADAFANAAFGKTVSLDVRSQMDGKEGWLRITLSPILRDARFTGTVIGTIQNITAQKLTEQRVSREMAFRDNVGVSSGWELDLETRTWSHLWVGEPVFSFLQQSAFRYDNYDAFLTETMRELVHPDDWDSYRNTMESEALLARFRRGEQVCSAEYRIRKRPASDVYEWRNVTVRLSRDAGTLHPKASCQVTDISPQKANELEAQREKRAMERAARDARRDNARKSQFLADTSRTLHVPLQAMTGVAQLALLEEMSPTAREYVQQISDFGDDLTRLLHDVLALADTDQDGISTEEEYSPLELLENVRRIALSDSAADAALSSQLDGSVPSSLFGDSMRLRQVLINVAAAALRAGRTAELRLSCEPANEGHVELHVSVVDRVSRLSEDQLANLFVAFSQADQTYGGGTGLGLSQARQLIRLMGGTLEAEALPEGGVTFRLSVPQRVIDARPISD